MRDLIRRFLLERGVGEFDLEEFIEYALSLSFSREEAMRELMEFSRPGILVTVKRDKIVLEIVSAYELLGYVLEKNVGKTLSEALEEFRSLFGDFEEKRLLRIIRSHTRFFLRKGKKRIGLGMLLDLEKRLDATIEK